jgi:hypothetical protein
MATHYIQVHKLDTESILILEKDHQLKKKSSWKTLINMTTDSSKPGLAKLSLPGGLVGSAHPPG